MAISKNSKKYGKNPKERKINPVDKTDAWEKMIRGKPLPDHFRYYPNGKKK